MNGKYLIFRGKPLDAEWDRLVEPPGKQLVQMAMLVL
jgi:hypothetical protein